MDTWWPVLMILAGGVWLKWSLDRRLEILARAHRATLTLLAVQEAALGRLRHDLLFAMSHEGSAKVLVFANETWDRAHLEAMEAVQPAMAKKWAEKHLAQPLLQGLLAPDDEASARTEIGLLLAALDQLACASEMSAAADKLMDKSPEKTGA